ncbi:MAG: BMC domain-containing protein [Myxococcota bacterium]|nr:BMC domain-containing protein [Myxococcota bacterium]
MAEAPPVEDALALLEFESVAGGLRALDALVKQAPVRILEANLVEPGRVLVLFCGGVAEVEASHTEAQAVGRDQVIDEMFLPFAHPILLAGLRGQDDVRTADELDALGVIEGRRIASTLVACDKALKDASVALTGIRVAGGLGGRAYFVVHGVQHDVEVALEVAAGVLQAAGHLHRVECIARPHEEMVSWLLRKAPFSLQQGED